MRHLLPNHANWTTGIFADCAKLSLKARTTEFICGPESEAVQLFSSEERSHSLSGDWYGEHVGKWLITAAHGFRRTGDPQLRESIAAVLAFLTESQEPDGYLGTYAKNAKSRLTHEDAKDSRTWDLWVHAWIILGILEAGEIEGFGSQCETARRAGELLLRHFGSGESSVLDLGNHAGLSSAILVEPLFKLGQALGDSRFDQFAQVIVDQLEAKGIPVLTGAKNGLDVAELGTGKIYQLLWLFVGLMSDSDRGAPAAAAWWEDIRAHHLNPLGGPWGGIAGHKEVFNVRGFFDPAGMVETCSMATWMSLCEALFLQTGEAKYVEEYEKSLFNALMGALDENGRDWCYFTFANGRRNNTYHWACCKSSGAMAVEKSVDLAVTARAEGVSINLFVNAKASISQGELQAQVDQTWEWDGADLVGSISLQVNQETKVFIRRPKWADAILCEAHSECDKTDPDWMNLSIAQGETTIRIRLSTSLKVEDFRYRIDHHGQEIVAEDYARVSLGPYVYACGRFDGFREDETLRLARLTPTANFHLEGMGNFGPRLRLRLPGRPAIEFLPYVEAGGRHDSAWRRTWLQVAWQ